MVEMSQMIKRETHHSGLISHGHQTTQLCNVESATLQSSLYIVLFPLNNLDTLITQTSLIEFSTTITQCNYSPLQSLILHAMVVANYLVVIMTT